MNVARKALAALQGNQTAQAIFAANGLSAAQIEAIATANPTYLALGAIGPDIFFLLPDFKPPVGNMLWKLANEIMQFYTDWDNTFLGPYESAMGPIGDNLNDELNALTGGLKDTIDGIVTQATNLLRDFILDLILQQYDFFGLLSSGVPAGFDEQTFFWSDMLHYRQTYRFGAELWQRATQQNDARFQAFALGWISHLATDVTGHAFVNQKAGGPYRLHWQRHHLVENHMDALVYNTDHGGQTTYNQMANSALHLWIAFDSNPPNGPFTYGAGFANGQTIKLFNPEPNPDYPTGDSSSDIVNRHSVWDVDSDLPDDLAKFLSDALKAVFKPTLTASNTGMVACCPTIISTLAGRVPIATSGFAEPDDIKGAYWWLYHYLKWVTTDYYNIRRPDSPDVAVIPSFPATPGSGDSDPGPGISSSNSLPQNLLDLLLDLFAWAAWLIEVAVWPAAAIAGIIAGTATYPLRQALYEYIELPLYNLWLGIHTYLAMTGYVMPMIGEINRGLNTLGVSVDDNWAATVAALGDPDGGITPVNVSSEPSGQPGTANPKDVVMDPPNLVSAIINEIFKIGAPSVNGELPSEFTRPWRWPGTDNGGDPINVERPQNEPGSFVSGNDANALFGSSPGSPEARSKFEAAMSEEETIRYAFDLLPQGKHLGDPMDYTAYVVAKLTRTNLDLTSLSNFNLDADRGYGYLTWDWVRYREDIPSATTTLPSNIRFAMPQGFVNNPDPSDPNQKPTAVSQHVYPVPMEPGYGWNPADQNTPAGQTAVQGFNPIAPTDTKGEVNIRYIDKQPKFV
jgi:hypothetical protein